MKKLLVFSIALVFSAGVMAQDETQNVQNSNKDDYRMWLGGELTFGAMSDLDFTSITLIQSPAISSIRQSRCP